MFDIDNVMYLELMYFCVVSWNIEMTMIVMSGDVLYCITWLFWWTGICVAYNIC